MKSMGHYKFSTPLWFTLMVGRVFNLTYAILYHEIYYIDLYLRLPITRSFTDQHPPNHLVDRVLGVRPQILPKLSILRMFINS